MTQLCSIKVDKIKCKKKSTPIIFQTSIHIPNIDTERDIKITDSHQTSKDFKNSKNLIYLVIFISFFDFI